MSLDINQSFDAHVESLDLNRKFVCVTIYAPTLGSTGSRLHLYFDSADECPSIGSKVKIRVEFF